MNRLTREWVKKAEADYEAAAALLARRGARLSDVICFHCQQCVEKYLKSMLQEHGIPFTKTHDLVKLLALALPLAPLLKKYNRRIKPLSDYAVDFRYPGVSATRRDAVRALALADEMRTAIRTCVGIKPARHRKD
jgi:HEPN domain-containing protein